MGDTPSQDGVDAFDWRGRLEWAGAGGYTIRTRAPGPPGQLPLTADELAEWPSGRIFGWSQSAGMGWAPGRLRGPAVLVLSTQGGIRAADGRPIALGFHTGHWELGALAETAAAALGAGGAVPYAAAVSDPCDGRSQGTAAMFDSLPYRNDAAQVMGRLIRSLPDRRGVLGIATCDKGLPAMMMALAALDTLPGVLVPGGTTLLPEAGEDAGQVQTLGVRFARGEITADYAREMGCRACASPGGGCQFLGTAATSQVVGEALGLALPHTALAPSGEPVWRDMGAQAAEALMALIAQGVGVRDVLTDRAVANAMAVHAAFGGSTNLLLHLPAIAHAAGLAVPTREDWVRVNRAVPRLVSVLPNGPVMHPTVRVYWAGGVPEVMLHLRRLGLLDTGVVTATGAPLATVLDWWEDSRRRYECRRQLREVDGVDADRVIMPPEVARRLGVAPTITFVTGNLAPEGGIIKSTAIDPSVLDEAGVYRRRGPARVFTREADAVAAIKAGQIRAGDVLVLAGAGPSGTGMEETYQVTAALRYLSFGKQVTFLTDARFSGVSTGACIGHISPEALVGGPLGRLRDGDLIDIHIDTRRLTGSIDCVGTSDRPTDAAAGAALLAGRSLHPALAAHPDLPPATRLWAALQAVSGGPWRGSVYDVDRIVAALAAGAHALAALRPEED